MKNNLNCFSETPSSEGPTEVTALDVVLTRADGLSYVWMGTSCGRCCAARGCKMTLQVFVQHITPQARHLSFSHREIVTQRMTKNVSAPCGGWTTESSKDVSCHSIVVQHDALELAALWARVSPCGQRRAEGREHHRQKYGETQIRQWPNTKPYRPIHHLAI